ncbi:MAG: hypothetical protein MJA30_11550 [Cytophagales bacterium]|nr:hypothetical protein [Cytophagales bacterium]
MKKLHYLLVILAVCAFACESDDGPGSSISISAEFDLEETLAVNINENDPNSIDRTINFEASDDDLSSLGEIDEYEIESLQIIIENYDGADNVELRNMSIQVDGVATSFTLQTVPLQNSTIDLTDNADFLAAVAAEFLENNEITLTIAGEVSGQPVSFDMTIKVSLKVTGSPS